MVGQAIGATPGAKFSPSAVFMNPDRTSVSGPGPMSGPPTSSVGGKGATGAGTKTAVIGGTGPGAAHAPHGPHRLSHGNQACSGGGTG